MSRALRVLHVIPSVGPHRGGPTVAVEAMTRGLAQSGIQVEVATTDDDYPGRLNVPLDKPVNRDGVTYHFFPRQTRFYTISWPLYRWLAHNVKTFDVVHVHAVFSFASAAACWTARSAGVPYIVRPLGVLSPYGLSQRAFLKRVSLALIERPLLNRAAAIHCTSSQEEREVRALDARWRTVVLPLGVDTDYYKPSPDAHWLRTAHAEVVERPYVLFLSRIHPKKRVETLLDALDEAPGVLLVIAGTGPREYLNELKARAHRLDVQHQVLWAGHLTGDEKLRALQAAALFVLPSHAENFGIAVVEALACGVPALVSDRVAISAQINDRDAGRVTPGRAPALSAALASILRDDAWRARMGAAARTLATDEFSASRMIEKLSALYESVRR